MQSVRGGEGARGQSSLGAKLEPRSEEWAVQLQLRMRPARAHPEPAAPAGGGCRREKGAFLLESGGVEGDSLETVRGRAVRDAARAGLWPRRGWARAEREPLTPPCWGKTEGRRGRVILVAFVSGRISTSFLSSYSEGNSSYNTRKRLSADKFRYRLIPPTHTLAQGNVVQRTPVRSRKQGDRDRDSDSVTHQPCDLGQVTLPAWEPLSSSHSEVLEPGWGLDVSTVMEALWAILSPSRLKITDDTFWDSLRLRSNFFC